MNKKYYETHKEEILEKRKNYYQEHKKEISEKRKNYYQEHKKRIIRNAKKYYQEHREEIIENKKKYGQTYYELHKEKNKEKRHSYNKKYYALNKEKYKQYSREYYKNNKELVLSKQQEKYNLHLERATRLLYAYKVADKQKNRGECDLTPQWIVDNIFTKPCAHCGESDWHKIGCNRLDNSKPHTMDNVEPCCYKCNSRLNAIESCRDSEGKFMKKGGSNHLLHHFQTGR